MRLSWIIPAAILAAVVAPTQAQTRPSRPTAPGREARYDGWNRDGAPRPPRMWRGHGGRRWADHYHACRRTYGKRYDYRTDMVRRGRGHRRCTL